MMWLARLKSGVALAAFLILATAGVAVQGRQQPAVEEGRGQVKAAPPASAGAGSAAAPAATANQALAREQLALIDDALAILHKLARNGEVSFSSPSFSLWGRRKLETLRKAGVGKAEMVAALEKYLDGLKQEEALAEEMHRRALATQVDVHDVRFRRMEAQVWLNEEKAR